MLEVLFVLLQIFRFLPEGMEGRILCSNFLKIYWFVLANMQTFWFCCVSHKQQE